MTPEIEACFEVIEAVMRFEPKREFAVFPVAADSVFGSIWCCCRSWRPWPRWFPPYLLPTWRVTDSSQFCCYQLCWTSSPLATGEDPHGAARTFDGTVCPHWETWPFSHSSRSLVSWQRGSSDGLSEMAFQQSRPGKTQSPDSSSPVCLARPGLLGIRPKQEQLGWRYQ